MFLLIVGYTYWRSYNGKAVCYVAMSIATGASALAILKPTKTSLTLYGPFVMFAAVNVATTMHIYNVVQSFYMAGTAYVNWYYIVNGVSEP